MRIIFLGREYLSAKGLLTLLHKHLSIVAVACQQKDELYNTCMDYAIPVMNDTELYKQLDEFKNIALVISFGFKNRIKKPLIDLPRIGCINFHPAPLPEWRGMGGIYNFAIYEGIKQWGVSAHFVDEQFDTGDIIKVKQFDIDPNNETAFSLRRKSHLKMLELLEEVIDIVLTTNTLPRKPQGKMGRYIAQEDFEKLRTVKPYETIEEIDRKARAFWCPPYGGAAIHLDGKEYTIVNDTILKEIGEKYGNSMDS